MYAILWKEFKEAFYSAYRIISSFAVPVFLLIFFSVVFTRNIGTIEYVADKVDYNRFFAAGLFGYVTFLLFSLTFAVVRIDRVQKVIAVILVSRVPLSSYFWGKQIANTIQTFLKVFVLLFLTYLITGSTLPVNGINIFLFAIALILGSVFWSSLGVISAVFITREDVRDIVFMLFTMPITFASSMYYNLERAPGWIKAISAFNPLTYTCNIIRQSFLLEHPQEWTSDFVLLIISAALATFLASLSLKKLSI